LRPFREAPAGQLDTGGAVLAFRHERGSGVVKVGEMLSLGTGEDAMREGEGNGDEADDAMVRAR
jgi:hypothetical protein